MDNLNYPAYARVILEKKLCMGYVSFSGRNYTGRICVHHKGGGSKRRIQFIDLYRRINHFGWLVKIFKTKFRSSHIGLIVYKNGLSNYIILSNNVYLGERIYSGTLLSKNFNMNTGITLPILYMNLFSVINCVELKPYSGIKLVRSAGMGAIISTKFLKGISLKLSNGVNVFLSDLCICSLGIVSNPYHRLYNYKKAGHKRALGIRPTVRGVAMNPHDHPHGGGEGRKSPPAAARSPWGWLTKGTPTIKNTRIGIHKKKIQKIR